MSGEEGKNDVGEITVEDDQEGEVPTHASDPDIQKPSNKPSSSPSGSVCSTPGLPRRIADPMSLRQLRVINKSGTSFDSSHQIPHSQPLPRNSSQVGFILGNTNMLTSPNIGPRSGSQNLPPSRTHTTTSNMPPNSHHVVVASSVLGAEDPHMSSHNAETASSHGLSTHSLAAKPSLKKAVTVKRALQVVKQNMSTQPGGSSARRWMDWGLIAVAAGVLLAGILGILESYVIWSVWKFGNENWEATSGSSQFVLVYLALFIFGQWFLALGIFDAAWNKNSMQMIACGAFNVAIFSYTVIQINQIKKLQLCDSTFTDVFTAGGTPSIYNQSGQLQIVSEDGKHTFDLLGPCPWSLKTGIVQMLQTNMKYIDRIMPMLTAIEAISAVGNICWFYIAYKVYQEYGWSVYQVQGASIERKWMITRYHFFILLLKLNIFFSVGIAAQMVSAYYYTRKATTDRDIQLSTPWVFNNQTILLSANRTDANSKSFTQILLPSVCIVVIVAALYYALGWYGIRRSSYPLMITFLAMMAIDMGAVTYALASVFTDPQYSVTKDALLIFCIIQLALNFVTWTIGLLNMRDFKKGLKALLEATKRAAKTDPENAGRPMPRTIPVLD
ncbi:hypothetical protein HDU76_003818 [Blyttiomyces sp. JEL0837]|nr:hypothetical protein HDU76_003818 [Blyttiomyces sp. JEL0837]